MTLQFVIGRSGGGKSRFCLDAIRDQLRHDPIGHPLILLVPEQATFQAEYDLVTTPGLHGTLRAQALSFRRLAFRVMQECGGTARVHIDDTGKQMLLYKIVHNMKEELTVFRRTVRQRGFLAQLNELFNELRRYRNDATDLQALLERAENREGQAAEGHPFLHKMNDVTTIYRHFQEYLGSLYVDAEDYLQSLADQARSSSYLRHAELWIDGFAGFTAQEYEVLGQLMRTVKRMTITLSLDREYAIGEEPNELNLFYSTANTMIRMKELAEQMGVKVEHTHILPNQLPRFSQAPMLAHLERHFADRHPPAYLDGIALPDSARKRLQAGSQVHLSSAVNPRAEIEAAARQIIRLVQEGSCRFRDIAVITRDIEAYSELIDTTFHDHQIPYFMDYKKNIMFHPVVELIRSSLEVVQHHWRYDAVFRCVKTDLISEDRALMDELENYVLAFGIHGTGWTTHARWEYALRMSLDDDVDTFIINEAHLDRIHQARMLVTVPLHRFEQQLDQAQNVREQVTAVYHLLEELGVPGKLTAWSEAALAEGHPEKAKEHSGLWNRLISLFDQMVGVLGEESMSLEMFAGMIDTGLESVRLSIVPPSLDQVLIGSLDRTRFASIRYAFVIGVNDGVIPGRISDTGILSEAERETAAGLGMEMAPDSRRRLLDEQFLAYSAFTIPSEGLWVSYSIADEEGRSMQPSEFIRRFARMFPGLAADLTLLDPVSSLDETMQADYLVHPERSLSYLIVQIREWMRGGRIAGIWWEALNWYRGQRIWRDKLDNLLYSMTYTNQEQALAEPTSRLLYGDNLVASVSRMERFSACPFMQFSSHGLRLQERKMYRLEAPDVGQLFHAALTRMAKQLIDEGIRWSELSDIECRQRAEYAVEELVPRLQSEILLSTERYQYMTRKLKKIVGRTAAVLGEHARRGLFEPIALELAFGPGEDLQPQQIALSNGSFMQLVGRIDRIDAATDGQRSLVRVIDYKSGAKSLSLSDVYYGISLQLLTYLDVAVTHSEQLLGKQGVAAGALYFHVHNPLLQSLKPLSDQVLADELLKKYKMKGLVAADPEVIQAMDNGLESGRSQIIPVGMKTDGGYYSDSQVATDRQFHAIRRFVQGKIKEIGTEIVRGNVAIEPYRKGKLSPCAHCSYRPVCQFDTLMSDNHYRFMPEMSKDELWRAISREAGEEEQ